MPDFYLQNSIGTRISMQKLCTLVVIKFEMFFVFIDLF